MGMPVEKIEVGFDLVDSPIAPFLVLDDPIKGRLDAAEYVLAGTIFYDITDRARSFTISRGKPREFSVYPAGVAEIQLNNHDRAFDPLYPSSPFYGNIIPRRQLKITSGTAVQFTGWVDDWNLSYLPNGDSVATAFCVDATSILATQKLSAGTPTPELTGARINNILDAATVDWPEGLRDIDTGAVQVGNQPIEEGTIALSYLQKVAASEPGQIFVGKNGYVTYQDVRHTPTSGSLVTFGGTGIPFSAIEVVYGSELLYNEVVIGRSGGGTAVAADLDSQSSYGIRNYTETDLLMASDLDAIDLAVLYADKYGRPEYRVNALEIFAHKLDPDDQAAVLDLEIGSICKIEFTPNGIGEPISQFIEVIRIQHVVDPQLHRVELGFMQITQASLVLDDAEFGKLDTYRLGR